MITIPKFLRGLLFVLAVVCMLSIIPEIADAMGWHPGWHPRPDQGDTHNVPELSVGAASGAAILLVGGILVILGRRRRNENKKRELSKPK